MNRTPDGRYGYQDSETLRNPVPVTCYGCHAEISGTIHKRLKLGPYGRFTVRYCDGCVPPKRSFDTLTAGVCSWCGRAFTTISPYHRSAYCTTICSRRARRDDQHHARQLWTPFCDVCRQPFTPPRADAIYCSPVCRQRAYRKRQAAAAARRAETAAILADYNLRLGGAS